MFLYDMNLMLLTKPKNKLNQHFLSKKKTIDEHLLVSVDIHNLCMVIELEAFFFSSKKGIYNFVIDLKLQRE